MAEVFFIMDMKCDPARVGNPVVLLGKTPRLTMHFEPHAEKGISTMPPLMHVSDFRALRKEFSSLRSGAG